MAPDEPKILEINFRGPSGDVKFSGPEATNHSIMRKKWERELRYFIAEAFAHSRETRNTSHEMMGLLPIVLESMHPSLLKPSGVDAFVDDQFL
mgnify:CR=1 FL=1